MSVVEAALEGCALGEIPIRRLLDVDSFHLPGFLPSRLNLELDRIQQTLAPATKPASWFDIEVQFIEISSVISAICKRTVVRVSNDKNMHV